MNSLLRLRPVSLPRTLALGLTMSVLGSLLLTAPAIAPAESQILEANQELRWYKGNLHTHSLWSDGDDFLEGIALYYKEHDYQFLVFTDHNVLSNSERWVEIEKAKNGKRAYERLVTRFPADWIEQRDREGKQEVRLKTFEEVAKRFDNPEKFLLIQGEEISDRFGKFPVHMNASNLREVIPPLGGDSVAETIQRNTDAVVAQRERTGQPILVHLNHPNFQWGVTAEDLMGIRGENFFEVYNGHPGVNNPGDEQRASTERIWDIILTKRLAELNLPVMYGLAVDDGHSYHRIPSRDSEPGRGWVVVLAKELKPNTLIEAMEEGNFYSSTGVVLKRIQSDQKGLEIEVEPHEGETLLIEFIGSRTGYDRESKPVVDQKGQEIRTTRIYSLEIGKTLLKVEGTKARYDFNPADIYVRARITSSRKHPNPSTPGEFERAWVQPTVGPGKP